MTTRGLPAMPGLSGPLAILPASNSERIVSTTVNLADTVATIAKEVGGLFKDVPYVKVFAGILLQIIKIREEIQTEKDRSQELVEKILSRSKVILDGLLQVAASPNRNQLKDTEDNLGEYNRLLEKILGTLATKTSKGMRGKLDKLVNRSSRIEILAKYDRLIDNFNTDLITGLLLKFVNPPQSAQASSGPASTLFKPIPRPDQMVGRDKENSMVVGTLLNDPSPRVTILGAGGMGKTTLALTAIHDRAVIERYSSRYFVSCEAVISLSSLVWEIANALRILPTKRDGHLIDTILSWFHHSTILCLDNFETVWEDEAIRRDVEDFLSQLDHVSDLAIIVTMRGTQRPSGVAWSKPLLPPLKKLSDGDSKLILEKAQVPVDEFTDKLAQVANGIPLAIKLIVAQLHEGNESPESLWARWERTQTKAIATGSKHRLSNLDVSIHLSVHSPRMQADPNAILIFAMLSSLPDGFTCRQEAIDELQSHLPGNICFQEMLVSLQRVSLIHVDGTEGNLRYRMLVPIREFGMKMEKDHPLDGCLATFYAKMMNRFSHYTDPASHNIIPPELLNVHSVFTKTLKEDRVDEMIINASIAYTHWCLYMGNPTSEVINLALQRRVVGPSGLHARCISALSRVYLQWNELDEAELSFKKAMELHRRSHSVLGEANDVQKLGDVYFRRAKLDKAESSFKKAMGLHQQSHDVLGEAYDVQKLGDVYLRRAKLDEAESSFKKAMELHQRLHDTLGEANDVQKLGDIYLRRAKLDEAESSFKKAMKLHQWSHSTLGEANDVQKLGDVYLRRAKLDEAESSFKNAMELHQRSHDVLGEAYDVQKLGEVYLRRDKLNEAESSFKEAIKLHQRSHDVLGKANDIQLLGDVYLRWDKLDEAESSFKKAMELHRKLHDMLGEANDVQKLGDVYLRRDRLDEAESSFKEAIKLHQQSHSMLGEANDIKLLGEVYLHRDRLDEAEQYFNQALLLHRQCLSPHNEAADLSLLEHVRKRREVPLVT